MRYSELLTMGQVWGSRPENGIKWGSNLYTGEEKDSMTFGTGLGPDSGTLPINRAAISMPPTKNTNSKKLMALVINIG